MKKAFLLCCVASLFLMQGACKKDTESVIDCLVEDLFVHISHTEDATDIKKVSFVAHYSGTHTVKSVKWAFGDGSTVTGGSNASHVYTSAGPYTVNADILIENGNASCTLKPTKSITVK